MTADFYLEFRLRFRRIHSAGAPALLLEVAGNPSDLTDPTGKSQFDLDDKIDDPREQQERCRQGRQIKPQFEVKLQELQGNLKQAFKVKDIKQDVRIDVGSIW